MQQAHVVRDVSYRFVETFGYVNLFPFMLRILPNHAIQLKDSLDFLSHPKHLWTPYGIRSLSQQDVFYKKENAPGDAPYWRGPIWMNMNYLIVSALFHYGHEEGPYQVKCLELYHQLRLNLISNVYREYQRTGFLWEQYADDTGYGQRCHPFTGWTSLIVLIMAERYD